MADATERLVRRGTTAQVNAMTPADGELVGDTDKETAVMGNGLTAGGRPLLREDMDNYDGTRVGGTFNVTALEATGNVDVSAGSPLISLIDTTIGVVHRLSSSSNNLRIASDINDIDAGNKVFIYVGNDEIIDINRTDVEITADLSVTGDITTTLGIYIGGTGSANLLDDVDETTATATLTCGSSGTLTLNTSFDDIALERFKNLVHAHGNLLLSGISSPVGYFAINLPWVIASPAGGSGRSTGVMVVRDVVSANIADFVAIAIEGTSQLRVYLGDGTNIQADAAEQIKTTSEINFSLMYRAV